MSFKYFESIKILPELAPNPTRKHRTRCVKIFYDFVGFFGQDQFGL